MGLNGVVAGRGGGGGGGRKMNPQTCLIIIIVIRPVLCDAVSVVRRRRGKYFTKTKSPFVIDTIGPKSVFDAGNENTILVHAYRFTPNSQR